MEQGREDVRKISEAKKRKNMNVGRNTGYDNPKRQNTGKVDQRGTLLACATCGRNHSGVCWKISQGN